MSTAFVRLCVCVSVPLCVTIAVQMCLDLSSQFERVREDERGEERHIRDTYDLLLLFRRGLVLTFVLGLLRLCRRIQLHRTRMHRDFKTKTILPVLSPPRVHPLRTIGSAKVSSSGEKRTMTKLWLVNTQRSAATVIARVATSSIVRFDDSSHVANARAAASA